MKKKVSTYYYQELSSTGMLFEFFPDATGNMEYDIENMLVYEVDLESNEKTIFDIKDIENAFNAARELEIVGYHNDIIKTREKYKDFNDFLEKSKIK